jgi:hypothetical protein
VIQSILLAALGFLSACLLFLFTAPAFWARAVRLTTQKLRQSLPISEAEIRASKDLIRAEYAVKVHQLTKSMEKARLAAHRQTIEINRRDATISRHTVDMSRVSLDLSEHQNAHAVLKQTINDRLPKLEAGIEDARQLLDARDSAIRSLEDAAQQQQQALEEAHGAYAQSQAEIERMRLALATAQGQDRRRVHDIGVETEYALRSELENLRATARAQADTIERLQARATAFSHSVDDGDGIADDAFDVGLVRARVAEQTAEIRQLRRDLEVAGGGVGGESGAESLALLQQIRALEGKNREQGDIVQQLRDEVDRLESAMTTDAMKPVVESKAYLKSRLEKMEAQSRTERESVGRLRAEMAAANERAARQAVYFRDELRRLGSRAVTPATLTGRGLAERSQNAAAAAVAAASAMAARAAAASGAADKSAAWVSPRAVVSAALAHAPAHPRHQHAAPESAGNGHSLGQNGSHPARDANGGPEPVANGTGEDLAGAPAGMEESSEPPVALAADGGVIISDVPAPVKTVTIDAVPVTGHGRSRLRDRLHYDEAEAT